MMTFAGSQSGKGATASIPNALTWTGSLVVIDVKGSHAATTARYRKQKLKQKVHIIDPFHQVPASVFEDAQITRGGFNPFSAIDRTARDIREQLGVIADACVVRDPGTREKHWDDGSHTIITGLADQVTSAPEFGKPSLPVIRDLLRRKPTDEQALWDAMYLNTKGCGAAREVAARLMRGQGTNERAGLLSNTDKHTEWLSSEPMREVLELDTFKFADLKNERTTIYFVLPPHYLETHRRFMRLFINLSISAMSLRGKDEKEGARSKVPVLMMLDEFLACGHMSEVVKAFGLMAGYNFVLWPFIQDLGRLRDLYGNSVNAFINNSRAVQVFGVSDEETCEFVSERIGERSMSHVGGMGDSLYAPRLRTPAEVAAEITAYTDLQYILRAGRGPLLIRKVRYYEDKMRWSKKSVFPKALMRRWYPFWDTYDDDPDYKSQP